MIPAPVEVGRSIRNAVEKTKIDRCEVIVINDIGLPKNFLENNPLEQISTAQLMYFKLITFASPGFNDEINKLAMPHMNASRLDSYEHEKEQIDQCETADDITKFMRKIKDPINSNFLIGKALAMQDEVVPLLLKRLLTSAHDVFIENATMVLANADMKYTEQLFDIFDDIKNPYARSELCVVFGWKKRVDYTSLLLKQYSLIKLERPAKSYEQGPLLALHLIHGEGKILA